MSGRVKFLPLAWAGMPKTSFRKNSDSPHKVQAVIVVIGPQWLETLKQRTAVGGSDLVRREIAISLTKPGISIVPVMVKGARMPAQDDLPDDIRGLVDRNAIEVRGSTWADDVNRLLKVLREAKSLPISRRSRIRRLVFTLLSSVSVITVIGFFVLVKVPNVPKNISYKYAKELVESHGLKFKARKPQQLNDSLGIDIVEGQRPIAGIFVFRGQTVEVDLRSKELYHLVCRGGGMLGKPTDDGTLVFEKHGDGATLQMARGTCAWRDRPLRESETPILKPLGFMKELLLAFGESPGGYVELCAFSDYPQPITDVTRSIRLLGISFDLATTLDDKGQVQWKTDGIYCNDHYLQTIEK